ncbi:hypothetical protein BU24DRAFT_422488 [Aaosphaeria arxii CBS 175.79]|uniref:Uncharacterized protein n=1 Tax=Aaosphaeria arxii CBS 175.79 TaxID=1450172 RepID=A0A6A5XT71_9PLEO|nr:uncharacterized protein BU24DRAFT_422488 [Aaosphaeria arxii CBS 175.79]KAF2016143.1 hypothetical protein BU24DRAFT_422488 [Aaosphaeria arxii CBS 175.79]
MLLGCCSLLNVAQSVACSPDDLLSHQNSAICAGSGADFMMSTGLEGGAVVLYHRIPLDWYAGAYIVVPIQRENAETLRVIRSY